MQWLYLCRFENYPNTLAAAAAATAIAVAAAVVIVVVVVAIFIVDVIHWSIELNSICLFEMRNKSRIHSDASNDADYLTTQSTRRFCLFFCLNSYSFK